MKNSILIASAIGAAFLAVGCGPSGKESTPATPAAAETNAAVKPAEAKPAAATSETASTPAPAAEVKPVAAGAAASVQESVKPAAEQAAQAASSPAAVSPTAAVGDAASQFLSLAQSKPDKVLASIGEELAPKLKSLGSSLGDQPAFKSQVDSTLKSLLGGDSAATIEAVTTLAQAKLTPEQTDLARQARDLAAAYVVQKDFSSLEGVQGEVATVVSSLRKGEVSTALPALSSIASKAKLTSAQKDLVSSIAEKYAPAGLKQAGDALQQGLKSIPGLGK